jgi:hydrogenase maturation protein HypF
MSTVETRRQAELRRLAVRVTGTVQGVGFRPFVFRLAGELGLAGWARNDDVGVEIEIEGPPAALDEFLTRVKDEAPPLATIDSLAAHDAVLRRRSGFRIVESHRNGRPDASVSPDAASCAECLAELRDPEDRRYRYPFINCTNCGPRFTIVRGVPYDRPLTTMSGFEMCERCLAEYEDPADRRFHAQPNACPDCGPQVTLMDAEGHPIRGDDGDADAIATAAGMLRNGRILAVKGVGGFHLACRADDFEAVVQLRSRKRREDRPFAIMAPDLDAARELVDLTPAEQALLCGRERPIVIARRRAGARVAPEVAPWSADLGVMLPYSPLHHLLLQDVGLPLVMTSGNVSDEPIAHDDEDAQERLGAIADAFLLHDRPIHVRTDDSVVRSVSAGLRAAPLVIRRSRGYAPAALALPVEASKQILACGAEQKSAFCLARGRAAWVGPHIGDLKNFETLGSFSDGVAHFERLFAVAPELVAHDLHPDYLSTRYALDREGVEHLAVQHHHAHLAACLAEHGELGQAVGAVYDGTGLGPDGTVWGGEILRGDLRSYERRGFLLPVRMPGGEAAIREPWRMACAWLTAAGDGEAPQIPPALRDAVDDRSWAAVHGLTRSGVGAPVTTSVGRLFDAVAAICGMRPRVSYEGQAAIELEGRSSLTGAGAYPLEVSEAADGALILDPRETVRAIVADLARGTDVATVGAGFHGALATATSTALAWETERAGTDVVALAGGVYCNRLLLELTASALRDAGLRVLIAERLPPNDGGIAYGQAAIAAAVERERS